MTTLSQRTETLREEFANALTHGLGAALSAVGLALMVMYAAMQGDPVRIVGATVFGATMVLLYLASTLYHSFQDAQWKLFFRKIDHSAIYLLIAGTYTPFTLVALKGALGWSLFGIVWGLAVSGIVFKFFLIHKFEFLSTAVYVAMGWLGVISFGEALEALSVSGMAWLVAGGLCYTVGVVFYLWRSLPYHHSVWHLFVMAGSFCHFHTIRWYVLPLEM